MTTDMNKIVTVPYKIASDAASFPTVRELDDNLGYGLLNAIFDGYSQNGGMPDESEIPAGAMGCTGVMKEIDGTVFLARNMDLERSFKPVYVYEVNAPDRYRSWNVIYNFALGPDTDKLSDGLSAVDYTMITYMPFDAINEYGLSFELNMRFEEYENVFDGDVKYASPGTNPGAKTRVCIISLGRYIADNCRNVREVLEKVGAVNAVTGEKYGDGEVDVFNMNIETNRWTLSLLLTDGKDYGVLELIDNTLYFTPKTACQGNYYLSKDYEKSEQWGLGYGRVKAIMDDYGAVSSEKELYELIKKVWYSQQFRSSCKYDKTGDFIRTFVFKNVKAVQTAVGSNHPIPDWSHLVQRVYDLDKKEFVMLGKQNLAEHPNYFSGWNRDYVFDEVNAGEIRAYDRWISEAYEGMTDDEIRSVCSFWCSIYTILHNPKDRTITVCFFENPDETLTFGFN